jgi:hypothetical protein
MGMEKITDGRGANKSVRYEQVEKDPGVADKRLLVLETEYAQVLKQFERQGNTLSVILRQAWEGRQLRSLTKNSPAVATDAHISLIGHCTSAELQRYLSSTEAANGLGNRHLWLLVKRSNVLPEGSAIDPEQIKALGMMLEQAIIFARNCGQIHRDTAAREFWGDIYEDLSEGKPGLAGSMLARGEAHVMRLACLYAVMNESPVVRFEDLKAALALWRYCEQSVQCIFGDSTGDPLADEILRSLRNQPGGMTRTQIRDLLGRHQRSDAIGQALGTLLSLGLARTETRETNGRPEERWYAVRKSARGA